MLVKVDTATVAVKVLVWFRERSALHVVPSFPFIGQPFSDREVLGACIGGGGGGRGKRPQSAKSILKR